MDLIGSNVVITANQFNPSIVTQAWLVKQGIASLEEFESSCIQAEGVSQINTKQYQLVIVPMMLQFVMKPGVEDEGKLIQSKVGTIIERLPHTPYQALGLNFNWHDTREGADIAKWTRGLFFESGRAPFTLFDVPDARFGVYLSKDFEGFRLKVQIAPAMIQSPEQPAKDGLVFGFNFHKSLTDESAVAEVQNSLSLWDAAKAEAEKIVAAVMEESHA